jgi:tRNA (adenine57-N1/adenine58-N1)-methyltransferase
MSFCKTNDVVKDNDMAIIYLNHNQLYPVKITKSLCYNMKYGSCKYADIIGKKYGSQIKCSRGTVYILQGSPELWTISLPHRTQILYTPDISFITLHLELKPGSVVFESGTGSASLSHAIIRSVFPNGHLHTFEFHQQRSETARKEFEVVLNCKITLY